MASSAKRRAVGVRKEPEGSGSDSSEGSFDESGDSGEEDSNDSDEEINEVNHFFARIGPTFPNTDGPKLSKLNEYLYV